jgi:hypothetical protein
MPEENTEVATITQPLISHPSIEKAIEVYVEANGDVSSVEKFFAEIKTPYSKQDLEVFFKKIDVKEKKYEIERTKASNILKRSAIESSADSAIRIEMIMEVAWKNILDIYIDGMGSRPKTKEARNAHKDQSKEFCELAKTYKDYHEMKLKILGMGKTEEEAKAEVESYFAGMMKKAISALDGMPDAQRKLQELLGFIPKSVEGEN